MIRTFKGIRNDLNLTIEEMAKRLGITAAEYKGIESGRTTTPASVYVEVCKMADLSFDELQIPKAKK